jgi:uncharacterized membrane protein
MTTDTLLVFDAPGAGWVVLGCAALLMAFGMSWWGLRTVLAKHRRITLLVLRASSLLVLGFLLLQPAWQHRVLAARRNKMALLVDASESMAFDDRGSTRAQRVASFMAGQKSEFEKLQMDADWTLYAFDRRPRPATFPELGQFADGDGTDLVAALSSVLAGSSEEEGDLSAVVLISDGTDTERLTGTQEVFPAPFSSLLSKSGVPVNTFFVGTDVAMADLAVVDVKVVDFAFIRNAVDVEVVVQLVGFSERTVPVVLEEGGRTIASSVADLRPGELRSVKLRFVPDRVGKFIYRVSVPPIAGETVTENNNSTFVLSVLRDKIRLLHVVGRPSWDERFLRQVLKRNPSVDLVSFYILRSTTDAPGVSQDELSLIPFPVEQLFGKDLNTFDLVLMQNFNHAPYLVSAYLPTLAEYVKNGGAFGMIGGELSFGAGGYGQSPIEEILPVRLRNGEDRLVQEFVAKPTDSGLRHPVLNVEDPTWLENGLALGSFHRVESMAENAVVLLAHPFERLLEARAPILALREVGRGRSMALLGDGSWRWNFWYSGQGGSPRPYQRFWNNVIRWLIRDPSMESVLVHASSVRYKPKETIRFQIKTSLAEAAAHAALEVVDLSRQRTLEKRSIPLGDDGRAEVEWTSLDVGSYLVQAEVLFQGKILGRAEDAFVVDGATKERMRPVGRKDLLEAIAKKTGGKSQSLDRGSLSQIITRGRTRYRVAASTSEPMLASGWVLGALIGLWVLEWWLRRRWGFR